jgi:hypothetical protein
MCLLAHSGPQLIIFKKIKKINFVPSFAIGLASRGKPGAQALA